MSQVYITEATFKQITTKVELPKDFQFKDTLIWELSKGGEIGYDNPVIFSDVEIKDLLTFKAICKDSSLFNITVFKKIQVRDSYRYITPEKNPCYHLDKDCEKLHADFDSTDIKIPEVYVERYSDEEEVKTRVNEYRAFFRTLTNEFNAKYGEAWLDDKAHKSQFAARMSMKFNIPDTDVFDRDEIGAKNSGVHNFKNNEIVYIKKEITEGFKSLWEDEDRRKLWREKKWLFQQSWLGNKEEDIHGDITPYSQEDVKRILRGIHSIKRTSIIAQLKHLYYIQYCPESRFDEQTLQKLGLRPCWNCARFAVEGEGGNFLFSPDDNKLVSVNQNDDDSTKSQRGGISKILEESDEPCDPADWFDLTEKYYYDGDGVFYTKDRKKIIACTDDSLEEYSVKDGCEVICDGALSPCIPSRASVEYASETGEDSGLSENNLRIVTLPETIRQIGKNAFLGCSRLKEIRIPKGSIVRFKQIIGSEYWDKLVEE